MSLLRGAARRPTVLIFGPVDWQTKEMRRNTRNRPKKKKIDEACVSFKTSRFAGDWEPVTDSKAKLVFTTVH